MSTEPGSRIAVLSAYRYRAESLAFTLTQQCHLETVVVADPAKELPSDFGVILIDLDMGVESALRSSSVWWSRKKASSGSPE
jgi:hypothetical protein